MLQWMGGSRKKVTTSRKSTQQRQKQYFEQRRLQQQQQQQQQNSNVIERYSDKKDPSTPCHENNRSLDILSLLNLSKNGQDLTSNFPAGRKSSNGQHATPNSQTVDIREPSTMQKENENLCPSEHGAIREKRIVSNHKEETRCPQKFIFGYSSSSHLDASKRNSEKDPLKMTSDHNLSVIDMLGDDVQNSSSRENLVHENHVSFSVEGLGKVEMKTPVHSPQHLPRKFSYGCPAPEPSKTFKRSSHYSKNLNHNLEHQFPELDDIGVGGDISRVKLKQKIMAGKMHDVQDFLRHDEFSENRIDHDRFKWHDKYQERSRFLDDDDFLDDDYGKSWKNQNRSCDLDYMTSRKFGMSDFSFDEGSSHMQKRRARVDPPGCFNVLGSSSQYKHQMDDRFDFMTSDMTRCDTKFNENTHCSDWPPFTTEDTRPNLHLSREDSFLPYPEWHKGTEHPSFNSTERQNIRRHETDSFSMKNTNFPHEFGIKRPNIWQQETMIGSDFSTPQDDSDWLFEERCNNENYPSHFDSRSWTKNQFDPRFYDDERPSSSRSKHGGFRSHYFSDKHEQVGPSQPSPVFSNINQQEYGHEDGFLNEEKDDDSNVQLQKSVSTRESESVTVPAVTSTFHQHNDDNTHDTNSSSSKNGTSTNVSKSEKSQVKTPEMTPCPNAILSPELSEGGSSSVEMPHKQLQECPNGTQTTLQTINEHNETEESGPNTGKVMMIGRFVVHLL